MARRAHGVLRGDSSGALVADNYTHFNLSDLAIPYASDWKPGAVALGVIAAWLLAAVELTSLAIKRLPKRVWRSIHLTSYAVFGSPASTPRCRHGSGQLAYQLTARPRSGCRLGAGISPDHPEGNEPTHTSPSNRSPDRKAPLMELGDLSESPATHSSHTGHRIAGRITETMTVSQSDCAKLRGNEPIAANGGEDAG